MFRAAVVEQSGLYYCTGGNDSDNIAIDEALCGSRILRLLANDHLIALGYEPSDIALARVIGYSAHRRALVHAAVLAGQNKLELARNELCVVEEHLVKVSETVEKYSILMLRLYPQILLHHRCHFLIPHLLV